AGAGAGAALGRAGAEGAAGGGAASGRRARARAPPPILRESRQYGAFVEGGGVDMGATPVAGLPERQAAFVFLQYLALHGAEGDFAPMLGTANPLPSPLDNHLYFGKMVS